jgi:hypothetical protein
VAGEGEEIDADEALQPLRAAFGHCLRDEGVPPDAAAGPTEFFLWLDAQLSWLDTNAQDEMAADYGRLYATCGEEWFTAREQLRGGQRRDRFVREHAPLIEELAELLDAS